MSDNIENIARRIQKLLALAGNNTNENEATAAAEKAMALAAEHGLELAQLEVKAETNVTPGGKREKRSHDRAAMYKYQQTLMRAVAETHFCVYMINEVTAMSCGKMRKVKRHVLLGRDVNVQLVTMLYDYLADTMDRLLPWQGMEKRGKQALLWLEGCADRLAFRLNAKRREMERDSKRRAQEAAARAKHPGSAPSENALVLSDVYSSEDDYNIDFQYGYEPGTTARRRAQWEAEYAVRRAENEALRAERQARTKALRSEFISRNQGKFVEDLLNITADLVSTNYGTEAECIEQGTKEWRKKQREAARAARPETKAERLKREKRQSDEQYRYNRRYAKYSQPEYNMGASAGDQIGLDTQVDHSHKDRIT